jgi:ubiquitin C-terminal hydrolase
VTVVFDPFSTLTLPVRNARDLRECLRMFAEEDTLNSRNKWKCQTCGQDVQAKKKIAIWRLPQCLIIHLKRFAADRKIDTEIEYPPELDLTEFVCGPHRNSGSLKYRLYAVSEHLGGLHGGHYTAHAKVDEKWYLFDDSTASLS